MRILIGNPPLGVREVIKTFTLQLQLSRGEKGLIDHKNMYRKIGITDRSCPWCYLGKLNVSIKRKSVRYWCGNARCGYYTNHQKTLLSMLERRILFGTNPKGNFYKIGETGN